MIAMRMADLRHFSCRALLATRNKSSIREQRDKRITPITYSSEELNFGESLFHALR